MHILLQVKLLWNKMNAYMFLLGKVMLVEENGLPKKKIKNETRGTRRKVERRTTENRKIQEMALTIENVSLQEPMPTTYSGKLRTHP